MSRPALAFAALLLAHAAHAQQRPDITLRDDFLSDTLADYDTEGTARWRKGAALLAADSALLRRMDLGYAVEVETTFRFADGGKDCILGVVLPSIGHGVSAGFQIHKGELRLWEIAAKPPRAVRLGAPGDSPWRLRVRLDQGLLRVKAWPADKKEPAEWRFVRYSGTSGWQPMGVIVQSGAGHGGAVTSLRVGSDARLKISEDDEKLLARAAPRYKESVALAAKGRPGEAVAGAREALAAARKALRPDHPSVTMSLIHLGNILYTSGEYREARRHLEEALSIRTKSLPPEHPDLAAAHNNFGAVLQSLWSLDDARKHYVRALDVWKLSLPPDHPTPAEALVNLGAVLRAQGRSEEALKLQRAALAVFRKALPKTHPAAGKALYNIGRSLQSAGRYDEALTHTRQALTALEEALPAGHPIIASAMNQMGELLSTQGDAAEAHKYFKDALALRLKALPHDHPDVAGSLRNLGALALRVQQWDRAQSAFEQMAAIAEKAFPEGHPDRISALEPMGYVAEGRGDLDGALKYFRRVQELRRKVLPEGHPDLGLSLHNIGLILEAQGEADAARKHFEGALAIRSKTLSPDEPEVTDARIHLGRVLHRMGKTDEAWPHLIESATRHARQVAALAAGTAQAWPDGAFRRQGNYADTLLTVATQAKALKPQALRELFQALLDGKDLSATALAHRRRLLLDSGDATDRADFERLVALRRRLADLMLQGPGGRPADDWRRDCQRLRRDADDLDADLAQRVQALGDWDAARRAGVAELAKRLGPDTVLVEMAGYQSRGGPKGFVPRYAALLLWRGADGGPEIRLVPLGEARRIDRAVSEWREHAQKGKVDADSDRELRAALWDPIAKALPPKTERLVIAPEGSAVVVPFEAIRLDGGKYLVERYAVSYAASGRDLMPRSQPKERPTSALVLADPDYDTSEGKSGNKELIAGAWRGPRFETLPGFRREADAVAKLLRAQKGWAVAEARGAGASEEALLQASRPRLLYCVTHGYFVEAEQRYPSPSAGLRELELVGFGAVRPRFDGDPRLRSGLALAGANKWQERSQKGLSDGLLTALEVENLDLWGTELVVLSACDTGLGQILVNEGVIGLRRAFQIAGARAVVASLWKVPDRETEQLMSETLGGWLKGAAPPEALRSAQREMIRRLRLSAERREAPPLYWAGFVCHGRGD